MILAERAARTAAATAVSKARSERIVLDLELERLRFQLAKAQRAMFGQSSKHASRIGQFELALEDIEKTIGAAEATAETE